MNDSQILSTFQDRPPQPASGRGEHALVFDACHVGVILRAVLFVVAVVAVGAMFGTIMTANVWVRILPAQKKLVAAIQEEMVNEKVTVKACWPWPVSPIQRPGWPAPAPVHCWPGCWWRRWSGA